MRILMHMLVVGSVVTYWLCLSRPGFYIGPHDFWTGFQILEGGWLAILAMQPCWLANPILFLSWIAYLWKRTRFGILIAWGALFFMLAFNLFSDVIRDEAGNRDPITALGSGYYFWLTSAGLACGASLIYLFTEYKRQQAARKAMEPALRSNMN
ncbi:MAG: hypothetical protein JO142_21645 [Burkholderiales bacterium]|nr:hypothetical protein [Burkholderiales bacterium]